MTLKRSYQFAIIFFIIIAVYYSALFAPICRLDDNKLIFYDVADAGVDQLLSILFSGGGYYRPLLCATFILDNYFWMLEESFLHLENVLLHCANALLLYAVTESLTRRFDIPSNHGIPFIVALLFVLNPLATESVNWISGRTDPLACLFLLLSLKTLLDWIDTSTAGGLLLIQLWYFLACLSKETAVFFIGPALLLVTVIRAQQLYAATGLAKTDLAHAEPCCRRWAGTVCPPYKFIFVAACKNWLMTVSFAIMTLGYFVLRRYAAMSSEGRDRGLSKLAKNTTQQSLESPWFDKLMEVFRSIGFYTKKIFAPWPLNFNIVQASDWYVLLGLLVVMLLGFYCWQRRDLLMALFLSAFLVASSALLVSVGKLAWTTYAERYLYIPLIFFIPASVIWLHEKIGDVRNGQLFRVAIILLCGASLVTTVQRNLLWMDGAAFYECNYRQAPNLPITMKNYAVSLQQQGLTEEANKIFKQLPKKPKVAKGSVVK